MRNFKISLRESAGVAFGLRPCNIRRVLTLRQSLLANLIAKKGLQGIIQAWPKSFEPPHRATLWRWLKGKSQTPTTRQLELAGAFDLDPFALFETTPKGFAVMCRALARHIGARNDSPLGSDLQWLRDFVAPCEEWPPSLIASKYFGREWKVSSFAHTARSRKNYFQTITLRAAKNGFAKRQIWHFAFKAANPAFNLWTPYGFVEWQENSVALFHYRGHTAAVTIAVEATSFGVETWFGEGSAEFRVASLHEFRLALDHNAQRAQVCVRFP